MHPCAVRCTESTNPVIVNNGMFVCGVCVVSLFDGEIVYRRIVS